MATLYLVPSDIALGETAFEFGHINRDIHLKVDLWIVEKLKTARQFLRRVDRTYPIDNKQFVEIPKHNQDYTQIQSSLKHAQQNQLNVGLISEAGYPAVADPGTVVVRIAHLLDFIVQPLIGPSSLIMALAASGLDGERFMFQSYFPLKGKEQEQKLKEVKQLLNLRITQIFIETPYRNLQFIQFLTKSFSPQLHLCVAQNLGDAQSKVKTQTLAQWNKDAPRFFSKEQKLPAIFILGLG